MATSIWVLLLIGAYMLGWHFGRQEAIYKLRPPHHEELHNEAGEYIDRG